MNNLSEQFKIIKKRELENLQINTNFDIPLEKIARSKKHIDIKLLEKYTFITSAVRSNKFCDIIKPIYDKLYYLYQVK